eukprot:768673-Hanusia_phi.AAC.10
MRNILAALNGWGWQVDGGGGRVVQEREERGRTMRNEKGKGIKRDQSPYCLVLQMSLSSMTMLEVRNVSVMLTMTRVSAPSRQRPVKDRPCAATRKARCTLASPRLNPTDRLQTSTSTTTHLATNWRGFRSYWCPWVPIVWISDARCRQSKKEEHVTSHNTVLVEAQQRLRSGELDQGWSLKHVHRRFEAAVANVIDDYSLVNFIPISINVTDKDTIAYACRIIDKANGYLYCESRKRRTGRRIAGQAEEGREERTALELDDILELIEERYLFDPNDPYGNPPPHLPNTLRSFSGTLISFSPQPPIIVCASTPSRCLACVTRTQTSNRADQKTRTPEQRQSPNGL